MDGQTDHYRAPEFCGALTNTTMCEENMLPLYVVLIFSWTITKETLPTDRTQTAVGRTGPY